MMSQATKADEKSNVQERILNAAEDLFANSSYSATRISDIATKAEVNQALVHYYFSTKEKLYGAVLDRLFKQWETYLEQPTWENVAPELVLRQYIQTHFDIKCKIPNLYKIFHKETLDGGQLFNQYASSKWTQDFLDKSQMFRGWKQAGIINSYANEQVVLFCLWGMMNQFYYRDLDSLMMITGHSGTKERLQEEIIDQMVVLAQHGLLLHPEQKEPLNAEQEQRIKLLYVPSEQESTSTEDELLLIQESITAWRGCSIEIYHSAEQWEQHSHSNDFLFIVTSSKYGELCPELMRWLQYVENNSTIIADRFIGIWTMKESSASDHVQRLIEDSINCFGGFAVSRVPAHTIHGYINRWMKMSGI